MAVDVRSLELVVTRRAGSASDETLLAALRDCGYPGRLLPVERARLRVCGLRGEGDRERVVSSLRRVRGVRQTGTDTSGCVLVVFDSRFVQCAGLVSAVRRAGYTAEVES